MTKPENSNSEIRREVGYSCPTSPFSPSAPCPGLVEGEALHGGKNRQGTATSRVSEMLQTLGGGVAVQITAEKRERGLRQWGIIYDAVHLKKGKTFPCQSKCRQKAFKKQKGDNIFMTAG